MSAELVAIELQLKGYDGVMSDMRALDQMLNGFRGNKNRITIESNLAEAKRELTALRGEMNKLKDNANAVKALMRDGIIPEEDGKVALESIQNEMDEVAKKTRDATQRIRELQLALRQFSQMSFGQMFNKISSTVAHMGSAMQSAGNALTKLTNPFANFTKGMVLGAGYQALNKFTSGFMSGFERMDTMNKYARNLQLNFNKTEEEATALKNSLNAAVEGLPTGLDEIVNMANQFTASMGDADKAAKLAIATNNAFLASQSGETARYQGMMQLRDVIGGKDMNAREWQSLAASMLPAIRMIGEEMGYTGQELNDYVASVQSGKIANEEFLDSLIKYGTSGKIVETARLAMDTWEAFFSRIGTASSRMMYGILTSMDELVKTATHGDVNSLNMLLDNYFIPGIDKMSKSIQKWIKAHPEEITDFFKSLKSINWGSIIKGFGEGLLGVADLAKSIADIFGGKDLSRIGRWMVQGNILGNFLTIAGGLLKGSRGIIAFFGASGVKGIQAIRNIRKAGGIMGWLGTLAVGENVAKTEKTVETVAKSSSKMGKFTLGVSNLFKGWAEIATMIGGSAFVAWGSMKLIKGAVKSFKEMTETLGEIDWDMGKKALLGIGGFLGGMATLSGIAGHFASQSGTLLLGELVVGLFTTLAAGFADIDMYLFKDTMKNLAQATSYFKPISDNFKSFKGIALDADTKDNLREAVGVLNDVNAVFSGEFNADTKQREGGLRKFGKSYGNTLKNIKDAAKTITELSKMNIDTASLGNFSTMMTDALTSISNMLTNIPSGLGDKGTVGTTQNLAGITNNLKTAFGDLVGDDGILNQIPTIVSKIKEMTADPELNQLNDFKVQMAELGSAMEEAYKGLAGKLTGSGDLMQRVTNFADAVYQARRVIYHLGQLNSEAGSVDISGGIGVIETTVAQLKSAFGSKRIGELQVEISNFVESIKTALDTIKQVGNEPVEIDAEVRLSSGFYSSVSSVVADINDAADDVRSAFRNIPNSLFKTIQVTISANVDTSGAVSAINQGSSFVSGIANGVFSSTGGRISRGGVLYRSGGGSIFRTRGTDKIPAMLTEGEYVQKKQAVDFFGLDFMRSVNNMDVRGAMEALLTRAGTTVGVGRQSIFNHTINNNQKVVQNINTNNPNFAGVQMGRFVGAL